MDILDYRRIFNAVTPCKAMWFSLLSRTSDELRSRQTDDISDTWSIDDDSDSSETWSSHNSSFWDGPTTALAYALLELDRALEHAPDEQIAAITFAKKQEKTIPRNKRLRITACGVERWIGVLDRHRFYHSSKEQAFAFSSTVPLFLPALQRIYRSAIIGQHYINSPRGDSTEQFGVGDKRGIYCSGALAALPEIDKILKTQHAPRLQKRLQSVKPFPFLSLPKDIRLLIYDYVLTSNRAIRLPKQADDEYKGMRFSMSLLAVSRSVHDEAAAVFYGYNTFIVKSQCIDTEFELVEDVPMIREMGFLVNLDIRYRRMITKLEWMMSYSHEENILDLLYRQTDEDETVTLSQLLPHLRSAVFFFQTDWSCRLLRRAHERPELDQSAQEQAQGLLLQAVLEKHTAETRHVERVGWDFGHCNDFVRGVVATMKQKSGGFKEAESVHNCVNDAVVTRLREEHSQFF